MIVDKRKNSVLTSTKDYIKCLYIRFGFRVTRMSIRNQYFLFINNLNNP